MTQRTAARLHEAAGWLCCFLFVLSWTFVVGLFVLPGRMQEWEYWTVVASSVLVNCLVAFRIHCRKVISDRQHAAHLARICLEGLEESEARSNFARWLGETHAQASR